MPLYDSKFVGKIVEENCTIVDSVITNETDHVLFLNNCMIINSELNISKDCVNSTIIDTKSNDSFHNVKIENGKLLRFIE